MRFALFTILGNFLLTWTLVILYTFIMIVKKCHFNDYLAKFCCMLKFYICLFVWSSLFYADFKYTHEKSFTADK